MRRICRPGRGALTNAAVPARQMKGLSSSSVNDAADQQEFADRIFRDQPLADRAVEREQEDRHQHVADAGKRGRTARWRQKRSMEGGHVSPGRDAETRISSHASQPGRLPRARIGLI